MAKQDQLEIISPSGDVSFVNLNAPAGISNIGRHPDNDIVINSPSIGMFHAILDHRQKPFKIVMLQPDSQSTVSGAPLPPNVATPVNALDTLVLGGFLVIPFEGAGAPSPAGVPGNAGAAGLAVAGTAAAAAGGAAVSMPPVAVPGAAKDAAGKAGGLAGKVPGASEQAAPAMDAAKDISKSIAPPPGLDKAQGLLSRLGIGKKDEHEALSSDDAAVGGVAPVSTPALSVARLSGLPADINDEIIITDMETRTWTIDVENAITATINLANGGDLVASFDVSVEGIDPTWLTISPPSVNLNEGQHGSVNITILAPRLPTSAAGNHYFAVHVTSSNYPGHASQRGATLVINPYYEFAIGELSPREQTVGFRKRSGLVSLPIVNRGNSETVYRLDAEDNERGCSFEFEVPGAATTLAKQAELALPSNAVTQIPIRVTPHHRRLIALRSHSYSMTVTTTPQEGQLTPRSVLGQVHASPLIGKWTILLSILTFIALFVIFFRPTIDDFRADRSKVLAKQPVNLSWHAAPFADLRIDNNIGQVPGPTGSKQVVPDQQKTTYHLTAENLLTRINSQWFGASKDVVVEVVPVLPVASFSVVMPDSKRVQAPSAQALPIMRGESITLYWEVTDAEKLILATNGANETIPPTDLIGKRTLTPDKDTVYSLDAQNQYGDDTKLLAIKVNEPPTVTPTPTLTPTPIPAPVILRFDIVPQVITAGESIEINWEVSNADTVAIQGLPNGNQFPPKGSVKAQPDKSTSYVLTAINGPNVVPVQRDVQVNPAPTPTATPQAPKIVTFQLTRTDVVHGSPEANDIQLIWLVTGDTTNIQISGPDLPAISNQPASGQLSIIGTKPTLFVITAMNGSLQSSQTVNLNVTEPTATPTPPPTATPLPPAANITQFQADSASGNASDVQIALGGTLSNTTAYTVVAGTSVKISWAVSGATTVLLGTGGGSSGVGPTGNTLVTLKQPATYVLTALNAAQMQTVRYIQFNVVPQKAPPAPTGVNGVSSSTGVTVTWSYASPDKVTGFRVYRATVPSTNYARVGFESQLTNTTTKFNDTTPPFCGTSYFVVGVYLDLLTNTLKETDRSAPVWYSKPCGS